MRINIDVDGVLAHFQRAFCKTATEVLGRDLSGHDYGEIMEVEKLLSLTKEEEDKVYALISQPGWARELEEVENGVSVVRRLAKRHKVAFVTAPLESSPTWGHDRKHWLMERFGDVTKRVVSTDYKHLVDADLLIEDRQDKVRAWLRERQQRGNDDAFAILFARPYNARPMPSEFADRCKRIETWFEIEAFIDHWLPG